MHFQFQASYCDLATASRHLVVFVCGFVPRWLFDTFVSTWDVRQRIHRTTWPVARLFCQIETNSACQIQREIELSRLSFRLFFFFTASYVCHILCCPWRNVPRAALRRRTCFWSRPGVEEEKTSRWVSFHKSQNEVSQASCGFFPEPASFQTTGSPARLEAEV